MKISQAIALYQARIVEDSISKAGARITTVAARCPASMLAQLNTHAALCRSAESSRAIPLRTFREKVLRDPVLPVFWGKNQKGMVAEKTVDTDTQTEAEHAWRDALAAAIHMHEKMEQLGVHKQIANRILEPWAWKDVVITATDWDNFFGLRCAPDAQPEHRALAWSIAGVVLSSIPQERDAHLPFITDEERREAAQNPDFADSLWKLSSARCARVSYAAHDRPNHHREIDLTADIQLADRLAIDGHASPFEHAAQAVSEKSTRWQKYRGWRSMRSLKLDDALRQFVWDEAKQMLQDDVDIFVE